FMVSFRELSPGSRDISSPRTDTAMWSAGEDWGMRPMTIGDPKIDGRLKVWANDPEVVRALFANERIRTFLLAQPRISFGLLPPTTIRSKHYITGLREMDRH